jgi:hypothetical protein
MGENRCDDINFRPLSGYCHKRKDGVNEFEFFPKRGIYASFGKDSTNGELKSLLRPMQLWLKNQRKGENIFDFR